MKKQIERIQQYFMQKIIKGDYIGMHYFTNYVDIMIDDEYHFTVYHGGNATDNYLNVWNGGFMKLPDFTPEQKIKAKKKLMILVEQHAGETRAKRIEELKNELKELEGTG